MGCLPRLETLDLGLELDIAFPFMGDMFKYLLFSYDLAFGNVSHRSVKTGHVIFCADW